MISEDYDHRWEALAEIHFGVDDEFSDENYIYCLCSRAHLRDGVKLYFVEKEEGSESDVEVLRETKVQELDEHSHVHFSVGTSSGDKVKCERDEGASCYCSASHTDNYCSTDEHEIHAPSLHALQPSDSGADLTYQEGHSENHILGKPESMEQDLPNTKAERFDENYLSENTWEKFWAINGERLIWASWIKQYSDYINPAYLDENNDLVMDENNIPKDSSADQIYVTATSDLIEEDKRERKFSYDSKVNPYKKSRANEREKSDKNIEGIKDEAWLPIGRRRSCSEHDRMLSPRTITGTDSMTNVTKITLSSYDVNSSRVTSDSNPSDDYSVSSSTSDDPNDQTRIANIDDNTDVPPNEMDTDQYWQFLWKKHFGEQYALHYANYLECDAVPKITPLNMELVTDQSILKPKLEIEVENSDGNSQETTTIIEVQDKVDKIKIDEKTRPKKKNKRTNSKYLGSVGVLLQNLLNEETKQDLEDVVEANDGKDKKDGNDNTSADVVDGPSMETNFNAVETVSHNSNAAQNYDEGDDDGDEPLESRAVSLKGSHEIDEEELESQKIKRTFHQLGLCLGSGDSSGLPGGSGSVRGRLVYRARVLRPPAVRAKGRRPRKMYFDDEGNVVKAEESDLERDVQTERDMQTDEDCPPVKSDSSKDRRDATEAQTDRLEGPDEKGASNDLDTSSDVQEGNDPGDKSGDEVTLESIDPNCGTESTKRRRRKRRRSQPRGDVPSELLEKGMAKYWKKRHSLFHRFDEGIRLDLESWFSVTPERVARHLAERCRCDLIVDAFCGAGGDAVQFARTCERVIAIDIDPAKIELARHNASVYGVADRIEFVVGDFFLLAPTLKGDVVFLSPPWGGPSYAEKEEYDLETMLEPKPSSQLMEAAQLISNNVALYVPRNSKSEQLVTLAKQSGAVEIEQNFLGRRFVALTAYYGDLVNY